MRRVNSTPDHCPTKSLLWSRLQDDVEWSLAARRICASYCVASWSTDGKFLFVTVEDPSRTGPGRSLAIPLGPGGNLPDLPPGGIPPLAEPSVIPGAESVARGELVPGKNPEDYAWVNTTVHRNLYRISLP